MSDILDGVLAYFSQHLTEMDLHEISDKLWTVHHHLSSDGKGLSGGTFTEQIVFEILTTILPSFTPFHKEQSDCMIQGHCFSFKKITGNSQLALNWSKNNDPSKKCMLFKHPILLLNLKGKRWWTTKSGFDRYVPMGFYFIDHVYCNQNIRLKSNNKTNTLIDAENLYRIMMDAMDNRRFLELPPPSTDRYSYSFNAGFHEIPTKKWAELPFDPAHPRFIDLFCGVGGFHAALAEVGGRCVFASDIDAACRENYLQNWGIEPDQDIRSVREADIPPFDILCAGFPCQPFSKAGDQKGFVDETKGNLFFEIVRILKHHRPQSFILENVKHIVAHDKGNTWQTIRDHLRHLGYSIHDSPVILSPLHYGIPQSRERAFIIGRRDAPPLPPFPRPTLQPTDIQSILLKDPEEIANYRLSGRHHEAGQIWEAFCQILAQHSIAIPRFPLWTDEWDRERDPQDAFYIKYKTWIDKNREFYTAHESILGGWLETSRQNPSWTGALRKLEWQCNETSLTRCLWTFRGSGIRVRNLEYSPTLVAMSMIPIYGPEWRKLTPREVCRLQSFPDSYQYHPKHCYKQMGNAVNVTVVRHIAEWLSS